MGTFDSVATGANLQQADLGFAKLQPDNTNFIEELKKDKASDPKEPVDCSGWEERE